MIDYLLVVAGLAGLFVGGEALIRGALATAKRLGVSPLLAGLVIVGFGTSTPELVVSVDAALHGQPGIAIGNVVGSNICNIMLILGLCAMISPMRVELRALKRDGLSMLGASVLFLVLGASGSLARIEGLLFFAGLVAYLVWAYRGERLAGDAGGAMHAAEADALSVLPKSAWTAAAALFGGLVILIIASRMLLTGAVAIAAEFGIPETVIGLTLVAIGTSLPELAVSLLAALRRHADVAVGNILGSNIFNLCGILGVSALIKPLPLDARILQFDQWVMLGSAVLLMAFLYGGLRLNRIEGSVLLAAFIAYLVITFTMMGAG